MRACKGSSPDRGPEAEPPKPEKFLKVFKINEKFTIFRQKFTIARQNLSIFENFEKI